MRICLSEQYPGLRLKGLHCIGTRRESRRWLIECSQLDQCTRKLCGISALMAVRAVPSRDRFPGPFRVVVNGGGRIGGGSRREQVGPEKTRFDEHRADAEGRDFEGERFDPPFDAEFRGGTR